MFSDGTTTRPSGPSPIVAGIAAGFVTLGLVLTIVWLLDDTESLSESAEPAFGDLVRAADLAPGDCVNPADGGLVLVACSEDHELETVDQVAYPDTGGAFPGGDELRALAQSRCPTAVADYIDGDLLDTNLDTDIRTPSVTIWNRGTTTVTCLVRSIDGSSLVGSVREAAEDYPRGEKVRVDRLQPDDCFVAADGVDPYSLSGSSEVTLVTCAEPHNGVFFGRAELDDPIGDPYPGDSRVSEVANARCGERFSDNFGVDPLGFNYRFWRPNEQSWEGNDRSVLCAVLDVTTMTEAFAPSNYVPFFSLDPLDCFNLGPEETTGSLRLDDRVLPSACSIPSNGQVVASGLLDEEAVVGPPSTSDIQNAAIDQCGSAYEDLTDGTGVGDNLGDFTLLFPNLDGWNDGDRRFACGFVNNNRRQASL